MTALQPQVDYAALLILVLLGIHLRYARLPHTLQNRVFYLYFLSVVVFVVLDISSLYMIAVALPSLIQLSFILNTLYYIAQFALPPLLLSFLFVVFRRTSSGNFKLYVLLWIPASLAILAVVFLNHQTGWLFHIDQKGVYQSGSYHALSYLVTFFYIVSGCAVTYKNRHMLGRSQYPILVGIITVSFGSYVFMAAFPTYAIMGFSTALICAEIYIGFQAPERQWSALTGLPNRQAFFDRTKQILLHDPETPYTIGYVNLRNFKLVNEFFGSKRGDLLLRKIADWLVEYCKGSGTCAHMEADHFVFCMPVSQFDKDRLLDKSNPASLQTIIEFNIDVLVGVYYPNSTKLPVQAMCDRASMALRKIGDNHVDRFAIYDRDTELVLKDENDLVMEIDNALDTQQFVVHYQPLCDPKTGEALSGEALIRWDHPKRGLITPGSFIALAERNGSIMKLDRYVWESTCRHLRTWIDSGWDPLPISVNVSRIDLYASDCVDQFIEITGAYDIEPRLLRIEITESSYMEHINELNDVIARLHCEGFTVMMDDFGSGYSSLGMLRDSPFDQVKFDMRFMGGDADSQRSRLVLTSMIRMLHELGVYTVVEGVGTQEQVDMVIETGCDAIQGFVNSCALPVGEFEQFVDGRRVEADRFHTACAPKCRRFPTIPHVTTGEMNAQT